MLTKSRNKFLLAAVFLAASCLLSSLGWAQDEAKTDGADAPVAAADADGAELGFLDNINQQLDKVDKQFGENVVKPMGGVIFNGLWTGDWTDEDGVEHKGWLADGSTTVPFIVVWLFVGAVFFTFFMGFINVRGFFHAIRLTTGAYDDPEDAGEVTHFQALSSALSGTVGLGNIAGVAIAVAQGGAGATFWMIIVGLLGMSSKFTECTLGQMYRRVDDKGRVSGGPMRYLKDGLKDVGVGWLGFILAPMFAILCIGGSFGGGNTFQISQSLDAIKTEVPILDEYGFIYGIIMVVAIGLVIVGGIKSIGKVASRIVPFMCAGYVACALFILFNNYDQIPDAFRQIWDGAFNLQAGWGAFLGCLVIGIKRAVFSNEAGTGSASIAHSAAKTDIPVREGYVALLEPFIDTVVVCTMTALVIIITGVVKEPDSLVRMETVKQELYLVDKNLDIDALSEQEARTMLMTLKGDKLDANSDGQFTVSDLIAKDRGAYFTKEAFVKGGYVWFKWFLYAAVVLFAFSTCISWYYYGERCFTALLGEWSSGLFKVLFLTATFLGAVIAPSSIKDFSDMLILGMAFPNMLGMYFLSPRVKAHLNEYIEDLRAGKFKKQK